MTLLELNEHYELRKRLRKVQEMRRSLLETAEPGSAKLSGTPIGSSPSDKVGALAVELADLDGRIRYLEDEVCRNESPILDFIQSIPDDQTRLVFRLRYVRALSFAEVADIIGGGNTDDTIKKAVYRYLSS